VHKEEKEQEHEKALKYLLELEISTHHISQLDKLVREVKQESEKILNLLSRLAT
jgi:hypothetical protein